MRYVIPFMLLTFTVGCSIPHAKIEMPPKGAPLAERVRAYKKYRPISKTTVTSSDGSKAEWLTMADGQDLYDPQDMRLAVGPQSETVKQLDAWTALDTPSTVADLTVLVGLAGGLAIMGSSEGYDDPVAWTFLATAGVAMIASLTMGIITAPHLTKAYDSYHDDLMTRLELERTDAVMDAEEDAEQLNVTGSDSSGGPDNGAADDGWADDE